MRRIQLRICPALQVQRLDLRQPEPRHPDTYRRIFGAPVHFAAVHDRLTIAAEVWGAPTASSDAALVALLEDHARILASRPVSMSEVAVLLGFSEQRAFNRAFRRWTGKFPGRWRRRAR